MKRLLFSGMIMATALFGQKREDFIALQRDLATLQEQVRQLQKTQDDRMAAMQAMLQQAVDSSTKLAGSLTVLQRDVDAKLSDQQSRLVAPIATTNTKIDQMSDDFRTVATNVADLARRMKDLDTKLADIKSACSVIQAAPPVPVPAVGQQASTNPNAPPNGMSAETLWRSARGDQSGGKLELAMEEYSNYVKYFPDTENAPEAQYQIGYMYFQNSNYDDAVQAFDAVLERWPENPKTQEALYYKGVSLQKGKHYTDAAKAYNEYLTKYPRGEHVASAKANLRSLGVGQHSTSKKRP
jgi:TolA-binding protein